MNFKIIKLILAIFASFLITSCADVNQNTTDLVKEKALNYLHKSTNKNLSIDKRIEAINKGLDELKNYPLDSLELAVLSMKSNLLFQSRQIDSSFYYDKKINIKALQISNLYYLARSHSNIGQFFKNRIQYDSAYYHFNKSKNYYIKLDDSSKVGKRLLSMGLIQKNQNDFFGSKETLTEALQYLTPINDLKYIASSYNVLATNHRKLSNFQDASYYYSKAIETTKSLKDKLIYKNNLAATFIDNNLFENAINLLVEIEHDSLLIKNQKDYARAKDNLAYARWKHGKHVHARSFLKPLNLRKQIDDKRGQLASHTHLGEFYNKTNPMRAIIHFDSVILLSKTLKIPRAEKDALKFLMKLRSKNVSLRDRYVYLQDSLYAQELKVKTQFAKYKYDDKLKQEDILRLENKNAEQELIVSKQRNQKILMYTIGVPIFMILAFLTYFFVQRSKRLKEQNKTAKLEANYETEAELSRKLHDDFGGKLNHAMLLLQSDANNKEVLNIVDGLYNQSRDFSREINDVDTGPNFKNFLVGMMGNYCKNKKLMTTGSTEVDWLILSPLSKKTLFKVLQELMINMQRYSNATLISIVFEQTNKILKVTYADDGVGATKEELDIKNGLWNTEKRIKAIGGTIIFDSEKGQGFEARIQIPN